MQSKQRFDKLQTSEKIICSIFSTEVIVRTIKRYRCINVSGLGVVRQYTLGQQEIKAYLNIRLCLMASIDTGSEKGRFRDITLLLCVLYYFFFGDLFFLLWQNNLGHNHPLSLALNSSCATTGYLLVKNARSQTNAAFKPEFEVIFLLISWSIFTCLNNNSFSTKKLWSELTK